MRAATETNAKDGVFGLVYPHSVLFHHSPWLFGFGGKLLDGNKPTLDTPENAKSLAFPQGMAVSPSSVPVRSARSVLVRTIHRPARRPRGSGP